jgi:hypothetical protein
MPWRRRQQSRFLPPVQRRQPANVERVFAASKAVQGTVSIGVFVIVLYLVVRFALWAIVGSKADRKARRRDYKASRRLPSNDRVSSTMPAPPTRDAGDCQLGLLSLDACIKKYGATRPCYGKGDICLRPGHPRQWDKG